MDKKDQVHLRLSLPDRSYQAMVRSELRQLAERAGFKKHRLGEVEIVIAEITSNLIKHATKGGIILARKIISGQETGIELIAIDNGPGMRLPLKMMEDGRSSSKTLGQGLGAIKRLSDEFDMYSLAGWGTVLLSRIYVNTGVSPVRGLFEVNAICVAKKDHVLCGDAWLATVQGKMMRIALIDGLGHGAHAHDASLLATQSLAAYSKLQPAEELSMLHQALKKTRGAVATIVHIDQVNHQLIYSGIGNIAMKMITPSVTKGCFSYNGIVGHIMPASFNNHSFLWNEKTDFLIMHSDGISGRWDIQKYPGILQHHAMMVCAAIYKDFDRANDDSTILIGKFLKSLNA